LYDPEKQKFLVVDEIAIAVMTSSVKKMDSYQVQIAMARKLPPSAQKSDRIAKITKSIDEHLNGTPTKPVNKKGMAGLIPLLMSNTTKSLYDRPLVFARRNDLSAMRWLDADDPEVGRRFKAINDRYEKRLEEYLKDLDKSGRGKEKTKEEKKKEFKEKYGQTEVSAGWKLWELKNKEGKPIEGSCVKNWILQPKSKIGENSRYFSADPQVQFLRYTLSAEAGANWDLSGGSIKLSAEGEGQFNPIDAKVTGDYFFPNKSGIDLFYLFRMLLQPTKLDRALKADAQFFIRLKFCLTGFAYVGASLSASVAIPEIDYSDYIKKRDEKSDTSALPAEKKAVTTKVGAEGEFFVGGKLGASLEVDLEWHCGDKPPAEFSKTIGLKYAGSGQVGIGIGGALGLQYEDNAFTFEIYLQATFKLGLSGKFEAEIDMEQAYRMVTHLARSVDYHKIQRISDQAYKKISAYGLAKVINAKNMAIDTWDAAYDAAAREANAMYDAAKKELLNKGKQIDAAIIAAHATAQQAQQDALNKLYEEQAELQKKLEAAKGAALQKKRAACKQVELLANQLSDFQRWLKGVKQKELDDIRENIAANVTTLKPYLQMLTPESAGPLLSL
jgi:hypothetical protein